MDDNQAVKIINIFKDRSGFSEWWRDIGPINRGEIFNKLINLDFTGNKMLQLNLKSEYSYLTENDLAAKIDRGEPILHYFMPTLIKQLPED